MLPLAQIKKYLNVSIIIEDKRKACRMSKIPRRSLTKD